MVGSSAVLFGDCIFDAPRGDYQPHPCLRGVTWIFDLNLAGIVIVLPNIVRTTGYNVLERDARGCRRNAADWTGRYHRKAIGVSRISAFVRAATIS